MYLYSTFHKQKLNNNTLIFIQSLILKNNLVKINNIKAYVFGKA